MPNRIDLRTTMQLRMAVRLGGLLSILLGAATLLACLVPMIRSGLPPTFPMMAPSTAVGLTLGGLSLRLQQAGRRRLASLCALVLLAWSVTLLPCWLLLHADPPTDWLLGGHRSDHPGHVPRIGGTALLSLILFALGMLGMASRSRRRRLVLAGTSLPGVAVTGLVLIGYAYHVEPSSIAGVYLGMSPAAAVCLFVLFLGSLAIEPERGWLALLMSRLPSARASRVQIALATTIPLVAGFVLLRYERSGAIPPGLAMAVMAIGTSVPLVAQILRDGYRLDLLETRRQAAVAAETLLSNELEQRVHDRTDSLARSEARLRGFVDNAVEGLALIRRHQDGGLSVETASRSLLEMYDGQAETGSLPQPVAMVLPADVLAELRAEIAICLRSREPHRYRARRNGRDGARLLDIILAPIGSDGAEQLVAASVRDITDMEQREEQLRQSQKMEAVGQLTGGLAHDFNNLLTGISGSLEMIQARLAQQSTDGVDRYLATAQEAGRRAASLTHRLLAFSRRQTLDPRTVEIDRIIAGMEELIRRTMGPAVTVVVQPSPLASTALIDANQFENALLNLCLNARDAMPQGGQLLIATFNDAMAATPDLPAGDYVRVRVADSGVGMSSDLVARAFDPFFTTKPLGQGTGLGLSMIYGFARQSGGGVALVSEPGRGTTVDLRLPSRPAAETTAPSPAEPPSSAIAGGGRTVLVVDDEPGIRMLVRDILNERGYRTLEAEDGGGGLALLRSREDIDLLLTDVGLPNGMNGRQLADAARVLRPGLSVLFITGYAEATVFGDRVLGEGMEVLPKPFTVGRLMDRVGALAAPARAAPCRTPPLPGHAGSTTGTACVARSEASST